MCYFPNGRRRRGRPLENGAAREGAGGEGAHLCFMPLYLLQMFSDTINSAVPFSRPLGQFLSPGSTLLALLGSASCRRPRLRFHELDYIQLTSVNCTHFVNRRRERDVDAASSSVLLILLPATNECRTCDPT